MYSEYIFRKNMLSIHFQVILYGEPRCDDHKAIDGLQQGCKEGETANDFKNLREMMAEDIAGRLGSNGQQRFQDQINKCAQHRKEYFFSSSASHRGDANYQQTMDKMADDFLKEAKVTAKQVGDPPACFFFRYLDAPAWVSHIAI